MYNNRILRKTVGLRDGKRLEKFEIGGAYSQSIVRVIKLGNSDMHTLFAEYC